MENKKEAQKQITDVKLEILSNGCVRFRRGDWQHNDRVKNIICRIVDDDEYIMAELDEFFKGAEGVEVLIGDTSFCG